MKIGKIVLNTVSALAIVSTAAMAYDADAVFERECQGCHGPKHQGGVGSDIRPAVVKPKNSQMLAEKILNGVPGTAMPPFKQTMSKNEAAKMVDYLQHFKGKKEMVLTLDNVKKTWRAFNKAEDLRKNIQVQLM